MDSRRLLNAEWLESKQSGRDMKPAEHNVVFGCMIVGSSQVMTDTVIRPWSMVDDDLQTFRPSYFQTDSFVLNVLEMSPWSTTNTVPFLWDQDIKHESTGPIITFIMLWATLLLLYIPPCMSAEMFSNSRRASGISA